MNPTNPITPAAASPSRTDSRATPRPSSTTSATAASRWAASARTMPKGVPPAAFAQTLALAKATQMRLPLPNPVSQSAASQGMSSQGMMGLGTTSQGAAGQALPGQSPQLQALALQAMLGDGSGDGSGDGMQSLFGSNVPGQNDLLQMLTQRLSAAQAAANAQAAPAPAATVAATPPPPAASGVLNLPNGLGPIVQQAAEKYGVDPALIAGVIQTESAFNPNAVSPAGARGLMQLMPGTARGLGVTNASDPLQSVLGGTKLLGQMLEKYHGNVELALAAYNAGSGNVDKYGGIPPFSETRRYVPTVLAASEHFRQPATTTTTTNAQTPIQPAAQTDGRARRS